MKVKRAELKRAARRVLLGNYGTMAAAYLIYIAIAGGGMAVMQLLAVGRQLPAVLIARGQTMGLRISGGTVLAAFLAEILAGAVSFLLTAGMTRMFYEVCTQGKTRIRVVFWAFVNQPWKYVLVFLFFAAVSALCMVPVIVLAAAAAVSPKNAAFAALFITLYLLALCIAALYVSLAWSQYLVILVEDPQKGIVSALCESWRWMRGNKLRYLALVFSFFGLMLLAAVSCGIGLFWVVPYMGCTNVFFYLSVKRGYSAS